MKQIDWQPPTPAPYYRRYHRRYYYPPYGWQAWRPYYGRYGQRRVVVVQENRHSMTEHGKGILQGVIITLASLVTVIGLLRFYSGQ